MPDPAQSPQPPFPFAFDRDCARALDEADPLAPRREDFHLPRKPDGNPLVYFVGNSLGLQPRRTRDAVAQELTDWADLGVDAHFEGQHPWYPYHEFLRAPAARLVGARPHEVVMMNGLTVNLHLLMVSLYRPTKSRWKILMEDRPFPSDTYAAWTQLRYHGHDPRDGIINLRPRDGEQTLRQEDIIGLLQQRGEEIALVLLGGVNFFSGQLFNIADITQAAHAAGCVVGIDLAHAAGNVPLALHDWEVDFAVWCTYKYLNSGPGAVAGAYLHERHAGDTEVPRFGGWWGNDPDSRFRMHLEREFRPVPTADAWQLSNPPILAMAPVRVSLEMFDETGMPALREKSLLLTGYLEYLLDQLPSEKYSVITPRDPNQRGAQLSILAHERPRELQQALQGAGVVTDFRPPNVIRVAPAPMYNTFADVYGFAEVLRSHL